MNYLNTESSTSANANNAKTKKDLNDSSLLMSSIDQMTTANAKLFILSSSPHVMVQQAELMSGGGSSVVSTSSIKRHSNSPILQEISSNTALSKSVKRLSGTEV
jgi:hypothetical protein